MPTETLTTNERTPSEQLPPMATASVDEELRKAAIRRLEQIRTFKLYVTAYVLSLFVLTPVWMVTQYEEADGWLEHLSTRSRYPGDWDPWILTAGGIWAFVVALYGLRVRLSRPTAGR